jgi:hypothetical protein
MYTIISREQDIAGRWLVRVAINDERTIFLNFDHDPSQEEVDTAVTKWLESQQPEEQP